MIDIIILVSIYIAAIYVIKFTCSLVNSYFTTQAKIDAADDAYFAYKQSGPCLVRSQLITKQYNSI